MKKTKINIVASVVIMTIAIANSQEKSEEFKLLDDERSVFEISNFHLDLIGFVLNRPIPISPLRWAELKAPGDYFRHPAGAKEMKLTEKDIKEVEGLLTAAVSPRYYDSYVLDNLTGYEYQLLEGKVSRREYYVKYGRGDTIYVISGLLGEFLSFYRAIPGTFRLSIDQIKAEAGKLSPAIEFQKKDSFTEMEDDYIYFVEYVDRDRMLRVRNYQVIEYWMDEDKVKESPEGKYYNLIEITRFLDEEAMP